MMFTQAIPQVKKCALSFCSQYVTKAFQLSLFSSSLVQQNCLLQSSITTGLMRTARRKSANVAPRRFSVVVFVDFSK